MRPPESWGHSTVDTACPLDCPDSCSLAVTVEKGKLVTIDGSRRNEVTGGYICAKVRRFGEHVYGDARLKHPAVRTGRKGSGSFNRVAWDQAMERIAERMLSIRDKWGAEAILPFCYGGSNGLLSQDTTDATLWRGLGTSRLARTVCAAPTGAANLALYGKMPCVTYADYVHARLIVIWGANPSVSGIHLVPYIREAQRRGAMLVVIDPRETPLARQADLHLAVQPGTDVAVALAVHRYLFESGLADMEFLAQHATGVEELRARADAWTFDRAAAVAGISADALRKVAQLYGHLSPAVIRCGWGLERNRNGGHAALAVLALPAVAGKFGVRGGGYSMSNSGAWGLHNAERWIGVDEPRTRLVNMNRLGRALTEYDAPPVQMLFVYNCNPLATMPDQNRVRKGLEREDLFTVVFEQVMNDTARYADVVLPATTFLETYDIVRSYGPISMQLARPVIDVVGESRPNVEVFSELCRRVGVSNGRGQETEGEALLRVAGQLFDGIGEGLLNEGVAQPPMGSSPIQFVDAFPRTPDRKIRLYSRELAATAPEGLYAYTPDPATTTYPLALISPASDKTISSTLGQLIERQAAVHINPGDAVVRNIEDGDTVRVFNDLGEVQCFARVDSSLRDGIVSLNKGLWRKSTFNGQTANALCPDTLTDLGAGACFNDARVEVVLVARA
jgi:anaerobic selenocysteine-containing dehydrogenase